MLVLLGLVGVLFYSSSISLPFSSVAMNSVVPQVVIPATVNRADFVNKLTVGETPVVGNVYRTVQAVELNDILSNGLVARPVLANSANRGFSYESNGNYVWWTDSDVSLIYTDRSFNSELGVESIAGLDQGNPERTAFQTDYLVIQAKNIDLTTDQATWGLSGTTRGAVNEIRSASLPLDKIEAIYLVKPGEGTVTLVRSSANSVAQDFVNRAKVAGSSIVEVPEASVLSKIAPAVPTVWEVSQTYTLQNSWLFQSEWRASDQAAELAQGTLKLDDFYAVEDKLVSEGKITASFDSVGRKVLSVPNVVNEEVSAFAGLKEGTRAAGKLDEVSIAVRTVLKDFSEVVSGGTEKVSVIAKDSAKVASGATGELAKAGDVIAVKGVNELSFVDRLTGLVKNHLLMFIGFIVALGLVYWRYPDAMLRV